MKLRELESLMQEVDPFDRPKIALEQYPTGAHLASRLLYTAATSYEEIASLYVLDLGCGTGMLGIGAAALGAGSVLGVDVDADALAVAKRNVSRFEGLEGSMDFVLCAAQHLPRALRGWSGLPSGDEGSKAAAAPSPSPHQSSSSLPPFDVAVTNPPFGTRRKGADVAFLNVCFGAVSRAVYSLHKSSTRAFLAKLGEAHARVEEGDVVAQMRYDLPKSYAFHKDATRDIQVDLWRYQLKEQEEEGKGKRKGGARHVGGGNERSSSEEDEDDDESTSEEDESTSEDEDESTSEDEDESTSEEDESTSEEEDSTDEDSSDEDSRDEDSTDEEEEGTALSPGKVVRSTPAESKATPKQE